MKEGIARLSCCVFSLSLPRSAFNLSPYMSLYNLLSSFVVVVEPEKSDFAFPLSFILIPEIDIGLTLSRYAYESIRSLISNTCDE